MFGRYDDDYAPQPKSDREPIPVNVTISPEQKACLDRLESRRFRKPEAIKASDRPGLTDAEKVCLAKLVEALKLFGDLPDHHPSDMQEMTLHLHAIQNLIAFRVARRVDPEEWWQPK